VLRKQKGVIPRKHVDNLFTLSNAEIETVMSLTERERQILALRQKDMTDYRIAKEIGALVSSVQRSRANALRKLSAARQDLEWVQKAGITLEGR